MSVHKIELTYCNPQVNIVILLCVKLRSQCSELLDNPCIMSLEDYISHGIIIIFVMSCNHRKYRYRSFQTHLNIKRPIYKETYMEIMTNTYNLGKEKD